MANVNYEAGQIKSAVYGEEVRDAIISALRKVATEGTELSGIIDALEADLSTRIDRNAADIALLGDNLYFDEEEHLLYLMHNGEKIGDGIAVSTGGGGGGGGGSMTFFKPRLDNELPERSITAPTGVEVVLRFSYSSVDDTDADDGPGIGRIVIGGVTKKTFRAIQGSNAVDITDALSPGMNNVQVKVENSEGTVRSLSYSVNIVTLSLTTTIEPISDYRGTATIYYTVTGSGDKTVHFILDGTELGTELVTSSGRSRSYSIDPQSHGAHILEIYATTEVDGLSLESERLRLCMYWIGESADPIIATPFEQTTATEGDMIVIPYAVYDPANEPASVTLSVIDGEGETYSEMTISKDRSAGDFWAVNDYPSGNVIFRISCGSTVKNLPVEVEAYTFPIEKVTDSLVLEFTAEGRANTESNPASWSYNDISATFEGFGWSGADGWQHDSENASVLRFLPGDTMDISFMPFEADIRSTGYTIEVDLATRDVRDYESVVASCMDSGRGFEIASQRAQLASEQTAVSMLFKEDARIRVAFVVEQSTQNRMVYIYINGILCGAKQYPPNDNFSQRDPETIQIGSNSCGLDLYRIRCYTKSLSRNEQLDNFICDKPTLGKRQEAYAKNDILTETETVSAEKLPADLPYMVFSGAELPQSKGDKKTMTITFVDPTDGSKSFVAQAAEVDVQGTSSAVYVVKNLKFKCKNGFTNNGTAFSKYALREGDIPVSTFCIKVDYASSEGANNVELVQLYEDICREQGYTTPPQEDDARVRQGIAGRPIALFWHDTVHNETIFVGKANFNNDKGTPETFGFNLYPNSESWEFKNNTSNICLFKSDDLSEGNWENDLEAREPDGGTDTTALQRVFEFVVAHDRDSVSTQVEKDAMLADFKANFEDYFVLDNMLFYYLFTEFFLMVDSRAKNMFLTTYDGTHWMPIPYDMDTAIGINNEGELSFEYDLEDTDSIGGTQIFNGQDSVLWNNVRDAYASELKAMYGRLRSGQLFRFEVVKQRFLDHQSVWPERMWNEDAYNKYLAPFLDEGKDYLAMLQGDKASQRDWWLSNAFKYRDSKYNTGDARTNFINIRGYTDETHPISNQSITLTTYSAIVAAVEYASTYMPTHRMKRNETHTFVNPMANMWDTEIHIYSADRLSDVGDLSPMNLGSADFAAATKLNRLIIGSSAAGYVNTHLNALTIGNNELLTLLNICNCVSLTSNVNLSGCASIETVLATGSSITGVQLPVGGHLERLELPNTITNLTIQSQKNLTTFAMEGYDSLSTLRIEDTPNVPLETIINGATNLGRVRLMGVEWTATNTASLTATIDRLDTCRGLDINNNTIDTPVVSGRVSIDSISSALLIRIQDTYPDLVVVVNGDPQYVVHYLNYDNTLLYNQVVAEGGSATDPITGGYIQTPTRPDDGDTSYVFSSWGPLPTNIHGNQSVTAQYTATYKVKYVNDDGTTVLQTKTVTHGGSTQYTGATPTKAQTAQYTYAFKEWVGADDRDTGGVTQVTGPMTITASYTSTVRSYTVRFFAEDRTTVLQTSTVAYGSSATYTGTTPVSGDGYPFEGWEPTPTNITGDTDCYPKFESPIQDVEIQDSWDTIISNVEDGLHSTQYQLGNYKPVDLGTEGIINMQIVAIDNEEAPLTFVAKELLATDKAMNSNYTNANGYPATAMKSYLDTTIWALLPANLKSTIKAVSKTSYDKTTGADVTSSEKLWIPSAREISGGSSYEQSGPVYTTIYKDANSRKKMKAGQSSATGWWLRSAHSSYDTDFRRVGSNGNVAYSTASSSSGVCLGFCLSPESISDSWDQINASYADGSYRTKYAIGDTKLLDLGSEGAICMQIAAFDTDDKADGTGKAAITWVAKQLLVTTYNMNSTNTNANGYPATAMKSYLDTTIWALLPSSLKTAIKQVSKTSYNKTTSGDITHSEKLWIPSAREIFGGSFYEQSGPVYSALFPDATSRQKKVYGTASATGWWLRSAYSSGDVSFRRVTSDGSVGYNGASFSNGVCLCFCTGDTPVDPWDEVLESIGDGTYSTKYSVGDTIPLNLGAEGTIDMQIAAFDADDKADNSGKAAITFVAKDLLVTKQQMNATSTNTNGYPATAMKSYLDTTIWALLPSSLKTAIKQVSKVSYNKTTSGDITHSEKLWIPSAREIFGGSFYEQSGPVYSALFPDATSRQKKVYGTASATGWWLRSANSSASNGFRYVTSSGTINSGTGNANNSYGVGLGFCL